MESRHPKKSKKWQFVLVAVLIIGAAGLYIHYHASSSTQTADNTTTSTTKNSKSGNIKIIATGDMLPHDAINKNALQNGTYNYGQFFSRVTGYFKPADISYCNQESPSASNFAVSGYPTFNAPQAFPQELRNLGCNVINLANNHADDRGQAGINQTLDVWKKLNPLAVVGTNASTDDQNAVHYFTIKGVKFAYIGYAECSNNTGVSSYGLNLLSNETLVKSQVAEARKNADFVMAGVHSCSEDTYTPDATISKWVQYFADNGVDAVIGTGPHWLQTVKKLPKAGGGNTVVWYSLGNFLSAQTDIGGLIGGIAVMNVSVKTHAITSIGFMPTYMHYEWTAAQKASQDLLARHDFSIYPLDQAATAMANSQDHTTIQAQTKAVTDLMNQYTSVPILTSKTYFSFN